MSLRHAVLCGALAVLASTTVLGTVVVPASLRELTADAALIVRGHVTDVRAIAVQGRGIESVATVAVQRVLKGGTEAFVSVRVPGGTLGRYRHVMVGAPVLRQHEHALFFLARGPDNGWRPVGLSAGVVRVRTEPAGGRLIVYPPAPIGRAPAAGPIVRGDSRRRPVSVGEFESMVEFVLAGQAASPPGAAR